MTVAQSTANAQTVKSIDHTEQAHQAHLLRAVEHAITYDRLPAPIGINLFPEHGWAILRFAEDADAAVRDWAAHIGAEIAHDGISFEDGPRRWHEYGSRPAGKQGTLVGWRIDVWCSVNDPTPEPEQPAEPWSDARPVPVEFVPRHQPEPEPVQEWLFTFGAGQQHDGRFVRITDTYGEARRKMNRIFGHAWCAQYDWQRFDEEGLPSRVTELPEYEWPAHAGDRAFLPTRDEQAVVTTVRGPITKAVGDVTYTPTAQAGE